MASPTTLGLVKTGAGFSAAADGTLSARIATTSQVGVVKAGVTANIAADGTLADAVGFRNRLRNASFAINQRGVSGTVTLAAGAYGHDGVKAGAAGAAYTFSTSGIDTTINNASGSIILPIEAGMIEGGVFVFSHAGTAQARVWQGAGTTGSGAYASAPFTVTLTAGVQTNVEFSTGTILRPQLEPGSTATVFERRPPNVELAMCKRFYQALVTGQMIAIANSASTVLMTGGLPVAMRAIPNAALLTTSLASSSYTLYSGGAWIGASSMAITVPGTAAENYWLVISGFSGLTIGALVMGNGSAALMSFSAEI
ncbi:hypothetical protein SAMN06265338_12425 [Rhodoblastus acidophilus]|uniref:Uncharacterized protein n=1 Tax=Rhodoblastus acidophilus TaxID=1074 RepID=A0A212SCE9_RHOAC|nr:hypothetical protein [Rhodoblastus acidophilus]PPQ35422.1 hypothetical protein CKO16_20685 [Rhodoblastus acidophilus]RAI17047.1 hypothetical protein CH337_18300 [Rhodoblastus acidophilus]SNB83109.1 hypothetical protein SAMN06265338_12425 [Rhodoblastus acidophilus]